MADQATRRPAAEAGETYQFRLWGGFAARRLPGEVDLTPRGRKARALLTYLLIERRPVDRDRLAGLLWSERGQAQARASLRQCLMELREFSGGPDPLLRVERQQMAIDRSRARIDLDEMLGMAGSGAAGPLADALAGSGTLLPDLDGIDPAFDDWLRAARADRSDALLAAAQDCARRALEAGDTEAACRLTQALQAIDPLDETLARLAMEVGAGLGRTDFIQRAYDRLVRDLKSELGVGPSAETRALREKLLGAARLSDTSGEAVPATPSPVAAPLPAAEPVGESTARPRRRLRGALALVLLLLAAGLSLVWWQSQQAAKAEPASLAVLPFRNLAPGDDFFAEGVAEEILGQLSREPEFRVAGRTSSWMFRDAGADPREIGRKLDVDYILEGTVRRAGEQVRINVALLQASNGIRRWSQIYAGTLDDLFSIQNDIGSAVAANLKRELVYAGTPAGPLRTSGEVYSLYLTARGLIRTREPRQARSAEALLRRAVMLDPGYAPGWSSLAQAMRLGVNDRPGIWEKIDSEAIGHVRRALRLAPELAAAHGTLGMLLGFESRQAMASIRRAAALDPNNAELLFWLGNVHAINLDHPAMLAVWVRANELDPLLAPAAFELIYNAVGMNRPDIARAAIARIDRAGDQLLAAMQKALVAFFFEGDLSKAAGEAAEARTIDNSLSKFLPDYLIGSVKRRVGLDDEGRTDWDEATRGLVAGQTPPISEFRRRIAWVGANASDTYRKVGVKRLLAAGRGRELADLYDGEAGLLEISSTRPDTSPVNLVYSGPLVAMVLREAGRDAEADRLLARADRAIRASLARGPAPREFLCYAAQIWALQGRHELALSTLERVTSVGWVDRDDILLPDVSDEPAFRSLRSHPRFEAIRDRINAQLARERRELQQLGLA